MEGTTHSFELDQIKLVPTKLSTLKSRKDIDYTSSLSNIKYNPIIPSPMSDVISDKMINSICLFNTKTLCILHRFQSVEEQLDQYERNKDKCTIYCSAGLDDVDKFLSQGIKNICLDVANGFSTNVGSVLSELPADVKIITGNVASAEGFRYLQEFNQVKGIRVGIAGGAGCTTYNKTGVYMPMASLIFECYRARIEHRKAVQMPAIIADGGFKEPNSVCKALALGADFCMMGSNFAKCVESPAELITIDGNSYKRFRGSASLEIQQKYKDVPKYIEGTDRLFEYKKESVITMLSNFYQGLQSSMSYMDAQTLHEYRTNVKYVTTR